MPTKRIERVNLLSSSPGTERHIEFHRWGLTGKPRCYIQASIHADEIPALLVAQNLANLLDAADERNEIINEIVIVPFANPIGLSQNFLGVHNGRFNFETGVNYNRGWMNIFDSVSKGVDGKLTMDEAANVTLIRATIAKEVDSYNAVKEDEYLKKTLFTVASASDIVLDLHCDDNAIMHMYTHDRLWPHMQDLCESLGSHVQMLDSDSGGNCFDESCSTIWEKLADKYPSYPIPMACQSCTVELRGALDVTDAYAKKDSMALFRFLQHRGYIASKSSDGQDMAPPPLPPLLRAATPLTAVDMIAAPKAGVIVWNVAPGDTVNCGDILGQIVDVTDMYAPRTNVVARNSGVIFGGTSDKLVRPGQVIIKVAGDTPLPWRSGNLLTP